MILKKDKKIMLTLLIITAIIVMGSVIYICIKSSVNINNNIVNTELSVSSTRYTQTIADTGVMFNVEVPASYGFNLRIVPEDPSSDNSALGGVGFIPALSGDVDWPVTISAGVKSVGKDKDLHQIINEGLLYPAFDVQDPSTGSYTTCNGKEFFVHKEVISKQHIMHWSLLKYNDKAVIIVMSALDMQEYHHVFEEQELFFKDILCGIALE